MISGFDCYILYLAIKQHFATESFDFFHYNGKVAATYDSYEKRKDRYSFDKLGRKYQTKNEIIDFLVANFMFGDLWIGNAFGEEATKKYNDYLKIKNSLLYLFKDEVRQIKLWAGNELSDAFLKSVDDYHPRLFRFYLAKGVSAQTLLILNSLYRFMPDWNKALKDDPVWQKKYLMMRKLRPFMQFDKSECQNIIHAVYA